MATTNSVTGDLIETKGLLSKKGEDNFERIFGKKKTNGGWKPPPLNEYPNNSTDPDEWDENRIDIVGSNGNTGEHYKDIK